MSDYSTVRLEKNGTVVAYLAPSAEVNIAYNNEVQTYEYEGKNKAIDYRRVRQEVTIQGEFKDSDDLPTAHTSALQSLFGESTVTRRQQANRVRYYMHQVGGKFDLYVGDDEYTASSQSDLDQANGVFYQVTIDEYRQREVPGKQLLNYTIRFVMGVR